MGLFSKAVENRFLITTSYSGLVGNIDVLSLSPPQSDAGVTVNENIAMQNVAVSAAIGIISETIGSLPLELYKHMKDGRQIAKEHPVWMLIHDSPNPFMTAIVFWELLMSHVLSWGNGYAEIEWGADGWPKALWPLRPDTTFPYVDYSDNSFKYRVSFNGQIRELKPHQVLHIHGLGFDGLRGYSPIKMHTQAIGLSIALEKFGASYFGNGAKPGGVLEHPGQLSDTANANLRTGWETMHKGLDNTHRIAILEEGMSYKQIGIPPEDSQFLESRKFQIAEIARIYRVPLHMLAELDRSTNNNIEHQSIEFVKHTIRPWAIKIEQEINSKLLLPRERKKYFCSFDMDDLLRGDMLSRYNAYQIARQNGWMSANDIRAKENQNPIPKEQGGNEYMVNSAMQPISVLMKGGGNNEAGKTNADNQRPGDQGDGGQ
ncbi:phage portal protein [Ectobacillus ponti]|uniref:Phage portal protein n=1 Tax=Ectobacillus ponti TaxID=2961894 RepID=A0AA41XC06_9BACI|nr:phage portal protein [Ectobacillus ponti]MCP8970564.1 phage portal protein [Ectobacillus ponti]